MMMTRARPKTFGLVVTIVATVIALSACGSGSGTAANSGDKIVARGPAVDGWTSLSIPLSPRREPVVATAGGDLFVWGGFVIEGQDTLVPLRDGAVYDVVTRTWRTLPPPPFQDGLWGAGAVFNGEEIVLAGTPCGPTKADYELATCDPGGTAVAAYSSESNEWRTIPSPKDIRGENANEATPVSFKPRGRVGNSAMFGVSGMSHPGSLLSLSSEDEWRWIAPPIPGVDALCAARDQLVGVATGNVSEDGKAVTTPGQEASRTPLRWFTADTSGSWTEQQPVEKTLVSNPLVETVACSDDELAYLPVGPPPAGLNDGILWFDGTERGWDTLPAIGDIGFPSRAAITEVDGVRILWPANSDAYYALPPDASTWTAQAKPVSDFVQLKSGSGYLIADPTYEQRPPTEPTVWIADSAAVVGSTISG